MFSVEEALVNIEISFILYFLQGLFFHQLIQTLRERLLQIAFLIISFMRFLPRYFQGAWFTKFYLAEFKNDHGLLIC